MSSTKSDSILITDKEMSLGCNMQLRRWFLTIFSLENERSPVQFVGIMVKYIRNAISMFGNVASRPSALIRLYSSDIVGCGTSF